MKISKNIRFFLAIVLVIWVLSFFGLSLFSISKGYINHFFTKIINPEVKQNENQDHSEIDEEYEQNEIKEDVSAEILSERFVKYSFDKDEENIKKMLADKTFYIKSSDGSFFIRYIDGDQHVEGYMATDRSLSNFRQKWYYAEDNEAISGMEIILEEEQKPLTWYLYFKKENGIWKLFMLENE